MTTQSSRVRRFFLSALLFATLTVAGSSADAGGFSRGFKGTHGHRSLAFKAKSYKYNTSYQRDFHSSRYGGKKIAHHDDFQRALYAGFHGGLHGGFYGGYGHGHH